MDLFHFNTISFIFIFLIAFFIESLLAIYRGQNEQIENLPYQVYIHFDGGGIVYVCGGALVSLDTVVTAASCFPNKLRSMRVYAGITDITNLFSGQYQYADMARSKLHPEYNKPYAGDNDIAIIRVPIAFKETSTVKPIKICSRDPYDNLSCVMSGWGETESGSPSPTLKSIVSVLHKEGSCRLSKKFCGKSRNGGGACELDRGDPLVCKFFFTGKCLMGVTVGTWGGCGTAKGEDIFQNVVQHRNFILGR